jgi:hypothetical protein
MGPRSRGRSRACPLPKRPSSVSAGRSRPATRTATTGTADGRTRGEEDQRIGSAPPRSRRARAPADREVGRFEEWGLARAGALGRALFRSGRAPSRPGGHARRRGPPDDGDRRREDEGRGGTADPARAAAIAPRSRSGRPGRCRFEEWGLARAGALGRALFRSGRAPSRPGGHARRREPPGDGDRRREDEGRGGPADRISAAAIATRSRSGRPGGRPLRGMGPRSRGRSRACHGPLPKRPSSVSAGRSRPATRTARRRGPQTGARGGEEEPRIRHAPPRSRRARAPADREVPLRGMGPRSRGRSRACHGPLPKRPSSVSAGRSRPATRTARRRGPQTGGRGARRTRGSDQRRRDRDALALRPTGRSAASTERAGARDRPCFNVSWWRPESLPAERLEKALRGPRRREPGHSRGGDPVPGVCSSRSRTGVTRSGCLPTTPR